MFPIRSAYVNCRETDRETDRQTDRQTDKERQRRRETLTDRDRQTDKHRDRERLRLSDTESETERHRKRQASRKRDREKACRTKTSSRSLQLGEQSRKSGDMKLTPTLLATTIPGMTTSVAVFVSRLSTRPQSSA